MAIEDDMFSSFSEAMEYFLPFTFFRSPKPVESKKDLYHRWVLWSHNPEENYVSQCSIEERIKQLLIEHLTYLNIVQFWAVKRIAGTKCFLTTTHQPFVIHRLQKRYCSYRKECMRRNINVGPEADEAQLGPCGRAFRSGFAETSPDIMLYTIQEFPLRDNAILCDICGVMALPVFELESNNILGVLEFLQYPYHWPEFHKLAMNVKKVGLRIDCNESPPELIRPLGEEMYRMFKEVAKTHPLAIGLASEPCCKECCLNFSGKGCLDKLIAAYYNYHMSDLWAFINARHHQVNTGKGLFWKAFASGKSCFCKDIRNFSLLEYPLVHYARRAGLTFSVATYVQSIHDKNSNVVLLEFFLLPGSYTIKNIRLFTETLLTKIKELLPSYKVAEDFPGEELFPKNYDSLKHDMIDSIEVGHNYDSMEHDMIDSIELIRPLGEKCLGVEERMKLVFENVPMTKYEMDLVQFWAPRRISGRSFLTTFDQAFAISEDIEKVSCLYRKECMRRNIYVDEYMNNEEHLGPAGRSFKNGVVESSPDVRLYTIQEFPLRDHVVLWGIRKAIFLPVFELNSKDSVGVIEILNKHMWELKEYLKFLTRELKKMGFIIPYEDRSPGESDSWAEIKKMSHIGESGSWAEIKKMFTAISVTYPLHFATSWTPFQKDHCHNNSGLLCFETSYSHPSYLVESKYNKFSLFCKFHHLQDKYGVAGKAFTSRRSCFCMNVSNLGITDYPLRHYAKRYGFTFVVAICVQNTLFEDKVSVLEFFLLPGDYSTEYIEGLLDSLLISIKKHLPPKFEILSKVAPGEPLFLEIGNILETGNKAINYGVNVVDGRETNAADTQDNISGMHVAAGHLVPQGEHISVMHHVGTEATLLVDNISDFVRVEATSLIPQGDTISTMPIAEGEKDCFPKSFTRQMEGNKFQISLDELQLHFGKPLAKAAQDLGVSRSTVKRIRKSYGIHRWPSHKKNKVNQALFMKENPNHAPHIEEDVELGSSGTDSNFRPVFPNQTDQHQTEPEVDKFVTIKASYGDDVLLKFQLKNRSSLENLQEEVAKRLKVEADTCNMKYQDEDGDWISMTIDQDLHACLQTFIARSQSTIRMSVSIK